MKTKIVLTLGFAMAAMGANARSLDTQINTEASANSEVVVSIQKASANKRVVAFDVVSDGKVAGFDFEIQIPGLVESSVNSKGCVAELPKGFNGACRVNNDSIVVTAIGNGMADLLPNGLIPVGKISYAVEAKGAVGVATISNMYLSDNAGQKKAGESKVLEQ